jgi:hypothetical protein
MATICWLISTHHNSIAQSPCLQRITVTTYLSKPIEQRALLEIVAQYASQNDTPDHAEPVGTLK